MYWKKKKYLLRKKVFRAIITIQRYARHFLEKLEIHRIRIRKEQEEYDRMMEKNLQEERKRQEYYDMLRRKEEAEKKKLQYFQQKSHISYLSQAGARPKTTQPAAKGKMSKTTMDAFNPTQKKIQVIKNTEKMLSSIYKEQLTRPVSKKERGKSRGASSRGVSSRENLSTKKTMESLEPINGGDDRYNMEALYKLFSKNIEYN